MEFKEYNPFIKVSIIIIARYYIFKEKIYKIIFKTFKRKIIISFK